MSEAAYERQARAELAAWRAKALRKPSLLSEAARGVQGRINRIIPEKVHELATAAIEKMTRAILTGSDWTTAEPLVGASLAEREQRVRERIAVYRTAAAAEGGVAGAGGFLLAAADFPALMAIKIKLLFEIAALYGHSGDRLSERLYILSIFQLAFSSPGHRQAVLKEMEGWDAKPEATLEGFDWRRFQQEYRDHIDLAKLAQLLPVVGAPIGAVVNFRLTDRVGETAMNAYRMRWFAG
jgi:hypothetical protein